jgi:hypothetical protein
MLANLPENGVNIALSRQSGLDTDCWAACPLPVRLAMAEYELVNHKERLAQAVQWISHTGSFSAKGVEQASQRFGLGPLDSEFLLEYIVNPIAEDLDTASHHRSSTATRPPRLTQNNMNNAGNDEHSSEFRHWEAYHRIRSTNQSATVKAKAFAALFFTDEVWNAHKKDRFSEWLECLDRVDSRNELREALRSADLSKIEYRDYVPQTKDLAILVASFINSGGGAIIVDVDNPTQKDKLKSALSDAIALISRDDGVTLSFRQMKDKHFIGIVEIEGLRGKALPAQADGVVYGRIDQQATPMTDQRIVKNLHGVPTPKGQFTVLDSLRLRKITHGEALGILGSIASIIGLIIALIFAFV